MLQKLKTEAHQCVESELHTFFIKINECFGWLLLSVESLILNNWMRGLPSTTMNIIWVGVEGVRTILNFHKEINSNNLNEPKSIDDEWCSNQLLDWLLFFFLFTLILIVVNIVRPQFTTLRLNQFEHVILLGFEIQSIEHYLFSYRFHFIHFFVRLCSTKTINLFAKLRFDCRQMWTRAFATYICILAAHLL